MFGRPLVRWYGLAYLLGFVAGFLVLRSLAKRGLWVLKPEKTADFIAAAALFGVFIGGRIGYVLFYHKNGLFNPEWFAALFKNPGKIGGIPFFHPEWLSSLISDPLLIFRVWEGGMASHGGIAGLMIFTWFYARKEKVTWTGLGDGLCVVAPLGLMFGRAANFINGELYGRIATGVSWAVKFPLSLPAESEETNAAAWQACIAIDPKLEKAQSLETLIAAARVNPELSRTLGEYLPARHPSQIYEGLLEGLALFLILYVVRVKFPKAPDGLLTGMFFFFYAIFRIFGEHFREPDSAMIGMFTKGQFFSFFMFLAAAVFFTHAWRGWKKAKLAGA